MIRFFNRNRATTATDPIPPDKSTSTRQRGIGGFGGMPTFGQWFRATALDILTMSVNPQPFLSPELTFYKVYHGCNWPWSKMTDILCVIYANIV
jgi:hypothetical protein